MSEALLILGVLCMIPWALEVSRENRFTRRGG